MKMVNLDLELMKAMHNSDLELARTKLGILVNTHRTSQVTATSTFHAYHATH